MSVSFFQKNQFQWMQREIYDSAQAYDPNPSVLFVFDFESWKVTQSVEKKQQDLKASLEKIKQKMGSTPFGYCLSSLSHLDVVASFVDFFYIPGEFCRQSDLLEGAKATGKPLVIEKGLFLCPNDIKRLCEKVAGADVCLVECGSSFGYSDVLLDPRSLLELKQHSPVFGVSLSDLYAPEGAAYAHRPVWLKNPQFLDAFSITAKAFGASFYVFKNYGQNSVFPYLKSSGAIQ
jgi:2-dehydro-3-deoxyphosphooctonate aldolase (KDO 8-P synthase)